MTGNKKVILINPPQNSTYPQPPLGLVCLAAVLEKNAIPVEILDANVFSVALDEYGRYVGDADIVGITAMTPFINSAITIARKIKEHNPAVTVILGGAHGTLLPDETLTNVPEIDFIVCGEGEKVLLNLVQALREKRDAKEIAGISYRKDGLVIKNPRDPPIMDLDSLPFPAYHLLPISNYSIHPPHGKRHPSMAMMTSRGCPYDCIYCSKPIFGKKFRAQSSKRTLDEIEYLVDRFNIREITFYDDSFTINKDRIYQLTDGIIKRNIDIAWSCETRVNLIDEKLLRAMKKAGCYMIAYGIESGNQTILNTLRKGVSLDQVSAAVALTRRAGILTTGYFMLGSPGETPETIRDTIDFSKKLSLDFAQFSILIPFPGTDVYTLYRDSCNKTINWDECIYVNLQSPGIPVIESEAVSKDDLCRWTSTAYREFYMRVPYIWQRLKRIRSWGDIKMIMNGVSMLFALKK